MHAAMHAAARSACASSVATDVGACTHRRMWCSSLSESVGRTCARTAAPSSAAHCDATSCDGARSLSTSHSASHAYVTSSVRVAAPTMSSWSDAHSCSLAYSSACSAPSDVRASYAACTTDGIGRRTGSVPRTRHAHADARCAEAACGTAACATIDASARRLHDATSWPLSGTPRRTYCSSSTSPASSACLLGVAGTSGVQPRRSAHARLCCSAADCDGSVSSSASRRYTVCASSASAPSSSAIGAIDASSHTNATACIARATPCSCGTQRHAQRRCSSHAPDARSCAHRPRTSCSSAACVGARIDATHAPILSRPSTTAYASSSAIGHCPRTCRLSSKSARGMCSAVAHSVRDTCSMYTCDALVASRAGAWLIASANALAKRACASTARTSDTLK